MKEITGTGVAMVTPFLADGAVDVKGLQKLTEHLILGGIDHLVVLGTTGETVTLSVAEQNLVIETIMEVNQGRLPLVLGAGGNNTTEVQAVMARYAKDYQPAAFLSASPAYNKPTQAGIIAHFRQLAAHTDIPIILYNVPGRTASNMTSATTLEIANSFDHVVAIKEASGDLVQGMEIIQGSKSGFLTLSGDDILTLPMLSVGFAGLISVIGNAFPKATSEMVRLGRAGNFAEAKKLHYQLMRLMQLIFAEGNPAGIKAVLAQLGICQAHVRLPLLPASADLNAQLRLAVEQLKAA
ncbi:MAG TPA: 4-hydroxy-tetrahydrodipicolinate synthase [Bacteroidetes bacterium]|nr:4-hydroxy-tetrahydrodipicolinate synthase [Bacteroidota bacterium]